MKLILLNKRSQCREEVSQLIRLSCYDQINIEKKQTSTFDISAMGDIWLSGRA